MLKGRQEFKEYCTIEGVLYVFLYVWDIAENGTIISKVFYKHNSIIY